MAKISELFGCSPPLPIVSADFFEQSGGAMVTLRLNKTRTGYKLFDACLGDGVEGVKAEDDA